MGNLAKRKKLAKEALKLIVEYENVSSTFRDSSMSAFRIGEDYRELSYTEGEMQVFYSHYLDNISEIYSREVEGCQREHENISECVFKIRAYIEKKEGLTNEVRNRFLERLEYSYGRCKDIYDRLKDIDTEASEVMK
ncbi:hypothetical protein [uncultured Clostridium sp.]|uniref:hypothetical protein n=1 Tax=uncultured Clostridium sp. TaxID=59620 RepID=UPI0026039069|nr:hypothetical protein [uncultured Clostridium sp.]